LDELGWVCVIDKIPRVECTARTTSHDNRHGFTARMM
jgi:hypothetical protein